MMEANVSHIDFLSLDVEGHEMEALSTLDLTQVTVDIIIAESGEQLWAKHPDLRRTHVKHGVGEYGLALDTVFLRRGQLV